MENRLRISEVVKLLSDSGFTITGQALRNWCSKYNIGIKIGSVWYIERSVIPKILSGEMFVQKYYTKNKE